MNYHIRKSEYCDLGSIVRLLADDKLGKGREAAENLEMYLASYKEILESPFFDVFVMGDENSKEIIGTYQMMFLPHLSFEGTRRAQIESVRILSTLRGKGLGEKLMEHAIEQAQENGCGIVQLTSNKDRSEQAHGFYKKLGFSSTHEV
ncbi:MAG: GNAT family N-acetyltransferase [Gammaproteobacteria bacterium]|nr:GNAT family N-acetyltransferase [Gammaproteobacteria bacterium]